MRTLFLKAIQQPIGQHTLADLKHWHGHVRPRPDGIKARCGGEGMCPTCKEERDLLNGVAAQPYQETDAEYARSVARSNGRRPTIGDSVEFGSDHHTDKGPASATIKEINGSRVKVAFGFEDYEGQWIDWPDEDVRRGASNGAWMLKSLPAIRGHRVRPPKLVLLRG